MAGDGHQPDRRGTRVVALLDSNFQLPSPTTPNCPIQLSIESWELEVVGNWELVVGGYSTGSIFSTVPSEAVPPLAPSVAT
jgi:hypothetical protein